MPIVVWVMIGFFEGLPQELEEAALIDGANLWQAFATSRCRWPGPASWSSAILAFIFSWNNFIFGVVLGRPRDAHAAGRGLQRADLRAARLGPARGRRAGGDRAGADRHHLGAAPDRRRADRGRTEGRLR